MTIVGQWYRTCSGMKESAKPLHKHLYCCKRESSQMLMWMSLRNFLCFFIYFVLYLFIYLFISISLYNFEFIYFYSFIHLFVYLFIYLFIYLLTYLFISLYIYLLLCLCIFLINYLQFSSLYCYHPVLIITYILNQIVYIKPCL